jgi:hypothetical protein
MRPSLQLTKLEATALSYIAFLRAQAAAALLKADGPNDRVLMFVVVEAHNTWALFVRSFYLSCVFSARRRNGAIVTSTVPAPRNTVTAIDQAMRLLRPRTSGRAPWPRRDEPPWQTQTTIIRLSQTFGFSNFAEITTALSYPTSVFPHLRDCRHFFSHRNEETMRVALSHTRDYGLVGLKHPKELLRAVATGRPQPIVLDWLDDISNIVGLMCD